MEDLCIHGKVYRYFKNNGTYISVKKLIWDIKVLSGEEIQTSFESYSKVEELAKAVITA